MTALLSAWLASQLAGRGAESTGLITAIPVIRAMDKESAARSAPVRVRGAVIATEAKSFVIHDGAVGLFIEAGATYPVPGFGREVVVEGVTDPGEFAPVVRAARVTEVGARRVAPLVLAHADELETGRLDCQWVEVEGLLRSAQPSTPDEVCYSAYATLSAGSARLNLSFSSTPFAEVQQWVGSRVRLRAATGHFFNSHGQLYGVRLVVPRSAEVSVLEPALARGAVPLTRIDSLLRYSPTEPPQGRVHVRGVVTCRYGSNGLYVQQDQRGVYVLQAERGPAGVGDSVDVVGFVRRGLYSPEIEDAVVERLRPGGAVVPRVVTLEEAKTADGELVQLSGVLLDNFRGTDATVLTLKGAGAPITASLPLDSVPARLPAAGSVVQLTGVVRAIQAPAIGAPFPWRPSSFELRLRTAADLAVLAGPEVGEVVWIFGALTALTLVALVLAGMMWWQSRSRLREQKRRRIAREAELAAMFKERNRLAREIHDSLAQGFTAVSIQLEMAKHKLPPGAAEAQDHLEAARALVRESLAEARRSIQGLRHGVLTNEDFLAALRRSGATILRDTPVTLQCEVSGDIARLGADAANELLRIAGEAMTNTVRHACAAAIRITYREAGGQGELRVADDGTGIPTGAEAGQGFGLRGMRERAERLNGTLAVSSAPSRGTEILVRLPLEHQPCNSPSGS